MNESKKGGLRLALILIWLGVFGFLFFWITRVWSDSSTGFNVGYFIVSSAIGIIWIVKVKLDKQRAGNILLMVYFLFLFCLTVVGIGYVLPTYVVIDSHQAVMFDNYDSPRTFVWLSPFSDRKIIIFPDQMDVHITDEVLSGDSGEKIGYSILLKMNLVASGREIYGKYHSKTQLEKIVESTCQNYFKRIRDDDLFKPSDVVARELMTQVELSGQLRGVSFSDHFRSLKIHDRIDAKIGISVN